MRRIRPRHWSVPWWTRPAHLGRSYDLNQPVRTATGSIYTSLSRNFAVWERVRMQFRWEIFNLFNHANYGLPNVNVNAPDGGTISSARDARLMQLALRLSF